MVPAAAAIPSSLFPGFSSKHSQDSHLSPDSVSVLRGKHSLRGHGSGTPFPLVPADLESHSPGGNRKENYRKSRGPYLDGFPKDSSALYALCALYKKGWLLKTISGPYLISHRQDKVSYSWRAREMQDLGTPRIRAGEAGEVWGESWRREGTGIFLFRFIRAGNLANTWCCRHQGHDAHGVWLFSFAHNSWLHPLSRGAENSSRVRLLFCQEFPFSEASVTCSQGWKSSLRISTAHLDLPGSTCTHRCPFL
ncbi:uncharacterized protein M8220_007560 [Acridotheres tristis]